jgi:hypothetical protein
MIKKTEGEIKNVQSRETCNTGYTIHRVKMNNKTQTKLKQ